MEDTSLESDIEAHWEIKFNGAPIDELLRDLSCTFKNEAFLRSCRKTQEEHGTLGKPAPAEEEVIQTTPPTFPPEDTCLKTPEL